MVKNTNGGGKAKKQGRKYQKVEGEVVECGEGESYGYVTEMKGGCECIVKRVEDGKEMKCKIGGKFRGRNKRSSR